MTTKPRGERRGGARHRAVLALEDGTVFEGRSFGGAGEVTGEVVFNTALCGYQEVLTDPSYAGQIVTMTYPHIGNYGVNREDVESARPQVAGFIVREASTVVSSWRASGELGRYLDEHGIVGISEIDTRALTRHLRTHGAKRGVVSAIDHDHESLVAKARASRSMVGLDLAREVTCAKPWTFDPRTEAKSAAGHLVPVLKGTEAGRPRVGEDLFRVVAYDFGMKRNILRNLAAAGCVVTVVPATTPASEALALRPEGIFLSNGPGDPEPCTYAIEAARVLDRRAAHLRHLPRPPDPRPRLRGQDLQAEVRPPRRQPPGQEPGDRPGRDHLAEPRLLRGPETLRAARVRAHPREPERRHGRGLPARATGRSSRVQYHPEASPGPHDSHYLFDEFVSMMRARREGR